MRESVESFQPMESSLEIELVATAKGGGSAPFLDLVRHHQRPVYRLAYAMTRNAGEARSLSRETFLLAWQRIREFPEGRRFFPWLLAIARDLIIQRDRRPAPRASRSRLESTDTALAAFAALRPEERISLCLRVVERLRYEDIAAILDVPASLAILQISQARGQLLARTGLGAGS